MRKDNYLYGAIFTPEETGYSIYFPDIKGCFSMGDDLQESIINAKESLGLHLYSMEVSEMIIPVSTSLESLECPAGSFTVPIDIYMPVVRNELNQKSVKKTVTLPSWLNDIAMKNNMNFSQVLQTALKKELNIKEV